LYKNNHKQVIAQDIKKIDILAPTIAPVLCLASVVMVTPVLGEHNIPMTIVDHDERRSVIFPAGP